MIAVMVSSCVDLANLGEGKRDDLTLTDGTVSDSYASLAGRLSVTDPFVSSPYCA